MLFAGVDEQFGLLRPDLGDQIAGSIDVALVCEELVVPLAVDLNRKVVGPWAKGVFACDREASFVEERSTRASARLGEPLCSADAPRDAGVDKPPGSACAAPSAFASNASPAS